MTKELSHKTPKSRIVYGFGNRFVRTHSDTLGRYFDAPITSERGRYLLTLLARNSHRKATITHETKRNVFSYQFGEDTILRHDKTKDRYIRSHLTTTHGKKLLASTFLNGKM